LRQVHNREPILVLVVVALAEEDILDVLVVLPIRISLVLVVQVQYPVWVLPVEEKAKEEVVVALKEEDILDVLLMLPIRISLVLVVQV